MSPRQREKSATRASVRDLGRRAARWWIVACLLGLSTSAHAQEDPISECPHEGDADCDRVLDVDERPGDTDGDGRPDILDPDDDDDHVFTTYEYFTAEQLIDTDGDGIPNYLDTDDDDDGIPTFDEESDPNEDGDPSDARVTTPRTPDYLNPDDDGDHVPTKVECPDGDTSIDTDGDGIPDYLDIDDDGDGIPTADEVGSDPEQDFDGDGIPDYLDDDDDGDGVPTKLENGPDVNPDIDGDGIPNYLDEDSDGDGVLDIYEGAGDQDSDGIPDAFDPNVAPLDSDHDGLPDVVECPPGNPCPDTDGDGTPDYLDDDDDGDGVLTRDELGDVSHGIPDSNHDGIPDYKQVDDGADRPAPLLDGGAPSDLDGGVPGSAGDAGAEADAGVPTGTGRPDAGGGDSDADAGSHATDRHGSCSVGVAPSETGKRELGWLLALGLVASVRTRRLARAAQRRVASKGGVKPRS